MKDIAEKIIELDKVADGILSEQDARLVEYYRWAAPKLSEAILALLRMHSPVQTYAYPDKCADPTLHREHWGVSAATLDVICPKCPLDTYFCLECFGEEYPCNTAQVLLGVKES